MSKITLDGIFLYVNRGFSRTLGYRVEELLGTNSIDIVMPSEYLRLKKRMEELRQGQSVRGRVLQFKSKDGNVIHMRVHARPLADANGTINAIATIGYDITDRVKFEQELRESEERYRLLFNHVTDLVILVEKDGRIREISPSAENIFGEKVKDFIGKYAWDLQLLSPEQIKGAQAQMAKINEGVDDLRQEYTIPAKDGKIKVIETITTPLFKQGARVGTATIGRDVTERKQMEAALRESEEKYRLIFNHVSDVIIITEEHGVILDVSPSVENLLGYHPEDFLGKPIFSIFVLDDEGQKLAEKNFIENVHIPSIIRFEYSLKAKDGTRKYVEVDSSPIIKDGGVKWTIHLCRDITERSNLYKKVLELLSS